MSFSGVSTPGIKDHRSEVDVLIQLEAQFEQQSLFQNAGLDLRMADGSQIDGIRLSKLPEYGTRQDFAGFQVTIPPQVVRYEIKGDGLLFGNGPQNLEPFGHYLRPGPVPGITAML